MITTSNNLVCVGASPKRRIAFGLLVCLGLCSQWARGQSPPSSTDDRARLLAALPLPDNSPLKKFEQLAQYREHAAYLATSWSTAQKERWDKMAAWAQADILPHVDTKLPLFYMFSGPDFLNAHILYPDEPRYVLCGLEPVGRVPAFETLREDKVAAAVKNAGQAMKYMLEEGFFLTKNMGEDLGKTEASGVLPLIFAMLARTGNRIAEVQYVKLDEAGHIQVVPGDDPVKAGARGVRIAFVRKPGARQQELIYFRTDLSDAALKTDDRFLQYLASQGPCSCYLKAAQYLMLMNNFTRIRELLLAQSATILQDDAGIPYRALDPAKWSITLYGNYQGPPSSISWAVQPELKKAYAVPGAVKPLVFKTSYRAREFANLLFAVANPPRK